MPETLKDYAKQIRTDVCFDIIADIKKAIRNKDEATALVSLGQLREQITLLNRYIDSFEKALEQKPP
ncbi:MAG TPA: hypothetical protein VI306_26190 [Pyrinomonadaceae bacterium]